ncbi:ATP-binding protein [Microbaculum marinum]|uniref:histidine kinase n=1 Tax=Microbaculum marinum TaxID=1764581 RepID=A0AAW9RPC9_9HYPH
MEQFVDFEREDASRSTGRSNRAQVSVRYGHGMIVPTGERCRLRAPCDVICTSSLRGGMRGSNISAVMSRLDGITPNRSDLVHAGGAGNERSATTGLRSDDQDLLNSSPPSTTQKKIALAMVVVMTIVVVAATPAARYVLSGTEALLPGYAAARLLVELMTAALLIAHFAAHPSPAILTLANGYLFSALLVVPWALTFPGVLEAFGLGPTDQSTAYVAAIRRIGFPLFILAYLARRSAPQLPSGTAASRILTSVLATAAAAAALSWGVIINDDQLPPLMLNERRIAAAWNIVPSVSIVLYVIALSLLWRRRTCSLDLWLAIVLGTLLAEIVLLSYISGGIRLSVGWWTGRAFGLLSASIVLVALLVESMSLYSRLARSVAAERRVRESRLSAMEAMSATVAHEVTQPVASMVTNANAALRWLDKPRPEIGEAEGALRRIVDDGHRAGEVISNIRTLFRKDARDRGPLDIRQLIEDVLSRSRREAEAARVLLRADVAPCDVVVIGNPVQLSQAISNLVANAIDATRSVAEREVVVRCDTIVPEGLTVSVEDTGPGIASDLRKRIFEPFFTTRPDGMGMGLMFSRAVVESHGGRLWVDDVVPRGAAFRFTLPVLGGIESEGRATRNG